MSRQKPSVLIFIMGIVMVIGGVYTLFHPLAALTALALVLGIVFIVVGAGYLAAYFSGGHTGWYLAVGLLDIFVGIILVSYLRQTMLALLFMFAFWCIFSGVLQIAAGIQLKKSSMPNLWLWSLFAGIIGIVVGFWILFTPLSGIVALTILLGIYLLANGIATILEYIGLCKTNN